MRKTVPFLFGVVLACSLSVSALAAQSPTGHKTWDDYTPIIATPAPMKIDTPEVVSKPEDALSPQPDKPEKPAIMPEYGKKPSTVTNETANLTGDKAEVSSRKSEAETEITEIEEIEGDIFEAIVRETVTQPDAPEVVEPVEEDPIKDSIPPEKMHYYAVDVAVQIGQTTEQKLQEVITKANVENRSIVSAVVITADEDVAWKIGKQKNDEDRYVAFTFLPEAIGITENDLDTLLVFVNGHPVEFVRNENGTISIKLAEWGLVTFEIAGR